VDYRDDASDGCPLGRERAVIGVHHQLQTQSRQASVREEMSTLKHGLHMYHSCRFKCLKFICSAWWPLFYQLCTHFFFFFCVLPVPRRKCVCDRFRFPTV
jgi:hypothetical protein